MNDSIQKSVNTIQSEIFDTRENITDGQHLIIHNELLNIYEKNRKRNVQLEEHEKKTKDLEAQNTTLKKQKRDVENENTTLKKQKRDLEKGVFNDKEIMLILLKKYPRNLEYASPELQNDFDIVKMAVTRWGSALQYASQELQQNTELIALANNKKKK